MRGRLWRMADPALSSEARQALVNELMTARRAVRSARAAGDGPLKPRLMRRSITLSARSANGVPSGGPMAHRISTVTWPAQRRMRPGSRNSPSPESRRQRGGFLCGARTGWTTGERARFFPKNNSARPVVAWLGEGSRDERNATEDRGPRGR